MKKILVTLISLTTLGLGIAIPLQAKAQPTQPQPLNQVNPIKQPQGVTPDFHRHHDFRVQYRRRRGQDWRNGGTFHDRAVADREARKLERQGYQTRVVTL